MKKRPPKKNKQKKVLGKLNANNQISSIFFDNTGKIIAVVTLILLFIMVYFKIFDAKLDLNGDNYNYLLLSKNILDGHGYSTIALDGTYTPAGWFPPGYPYILAISQFFLGENVESLKMVNGLLFLFSVLLFFFISEKFSKNLFFAFSISTLLALNSGLLRFSTILMSEIPYLFFILLAIYSLLKIDEDNEKTTFWKSRWFYLIVLSSIISYYIRGFGITLICAIAFHWLLNKKWKLSISYLVFIFILFLPYYIRNKIYGIGDRYLKTIFVDNPWRPESGGISTFSQFYDKIVTNLNDTIIFGFPEVLFPSIDVSNPGFSLILFGLTILCFSFLGIWQIKKYRYFLGSFLILNIGIFLLWHTGNGARYVWPLTGFVMLCSFYGIYNSLMYLFRRLNFQFLVKYFGLVFLLLAFFHLSSIQELKAQAESKLAPAYDNYFSIAKTLRGRGEKAIVVCRKPALFSYHSKTLTSNYRYTLDDKELIQNLIDINADYVVIDQLGYSSTPRYLVPAIQKNQQLFNIELHLQNPDTYLLRFNKEAARMLITDSISEKK